MGEYELIQELKNEIIKWSPSELLEIITIMGSLPQNNAHIIRLETLFKIITSIPQK